MFRQIFANGATATSLPRTRPKGGTADHVVVAAERLTSKGAYVACSRGRQVLRRLHSRQGAPNRKITGGKSPRRLGCAFRNSP